MQQHDTIVLEKAISQIVFHLLDEPVAPIFCKETLKQRDTYNVSRSEKVPEIETCVKRRRKLLYKLPERLQISETYTAKSQNTTFMLFAKVKVWKHQGKKENERKTLYF